jgi:hypothetical protein
MALWGDIDVAAVTGTNITTNSSVDVVCAGGDGAFTTELAVGEYLVFSNQAGVEYQIKSITDNNNLALTAVTTNADAANLTATKTEKPAYDNENVFGITSAEAGTTGASPGWVKVTNGTGNRAGRVQYETLVAFGDHTKPSESADLDTGLFGVITLSTVADQSAATGQAEAFSVTATTTNSVTATFQWQVQTGGTGAFADIAGATTGTLTIADNTGLGGNRYRCVVSGTGATTVTSNSALLTET